MTKESTYINKLKKTKIFRFVRPFLLGIINARRSVYTFFSTLSESIRIRKNYSVRERHIFFCGYSESSNLGDMAQISISFKIFKDLYPDISIIPCKRSHILCQCSFYIKALKTILRSDDVFVMESGYNSNDGPQNKMHQKIVKLFPDNAMLFLPQTICFNDVNNQKNSSTVFNNHKNLHFMCRDIVSYQIAQKLFQNCKLSLHPDLATFMIGNRNIHSITERKGVLIIKRRDAESYYDRNDVCHLLSILPHNINTEIIDTYIDVSKKKVMNSRDKYIELMLCKISSYKAVITDRYHDLIFGLITNTPVIVLKTTNHKVTTGYDWLKAEYPDNLFFAENINEARDLAVKIHDENRTVNNYNNFFLKYYDSFIKDVQECMDNCD